MFMALWVSSHNQMTNFSINPLKKFNLLGAVESGRLKIEVSVGAIAELSPFASYKSVDYRKDSQPKIVDTLRGSAPQFTTMSGITGNIWIMVIPIWTVLMVVTAFTLFLFLMRRKASMKLRRPESAPV